MTMISSIPNKLTAREWKNAAGTRVRIEDYVHAVPGGFLFAVKLASGAYDAPEAIREGTRLRRSFVRAQTIALLVANGAQVFADLRKVYYYAEHKAGFTWRVAKPATEEASFTEKTIAALDLTQKYTIAEIAKMTDRSHQFVSDTLDKPASYFGDPKSWPSVQEARAAS